MAGSYIHSLGELIVMDCYQQKTAIVFLIMWEFLLHNIIIYLFAL